jgi:leucyl aminopeptidase
VRSYKGTTVRIDNTDAEGRLVLADTLTYVQKQYAPQTIVDFATLTGACVIALGEYVSGLFCNDEKLASGLISAGEAVDERCWRMPLLEEYAEELKGKECDLHSMGKGRYGGACTAAAFLSHFVDEGRQWAHVDIAGTGMASAPRGYVCANGTGYGVQLVVKYLQSSM